MNLGHNPIENVDVNCVEPDQSLRRLLWMRDHTPHRARACLMNNLVFARNRCVVLRFSQVYPCEDADQNAEDCRGDAWCVASPMNERRSDRWSDNSPKTRGGRQPTKTFRSIVRIAGVGDIRLHDTDRAATQTLDDAREQK